MNCDGWDPRRLLLLPEHLVDLRNSGLSDETIRAARIYSETDPKKIRLALRWRRPADCLGHCLAFPFPDLDGRLNGFVRFKPNNPRTEVKKDGTFRLIKYENPMGTGIIRAYFVPAAFEAIRSPTVRLLITEGEKKTLCASQHAFPTIGLCGVDMWGVSLRDSTGKKIGVRRLIKDLERINWAGRIVIIIFDTDSDHRPNVARAAAQLAQELSDVAPSSTLFICH